MKREIYDVLVIGEGVSGLTAAQALAQHGLRVATLEARLFGGLVTNVNELDPAPEQRAVSGADYAADLMQANFDLGIASIQKTVSDLEIEGGIIQAVAAGATFSARGIIIASGARFKKLGVPGETDYEGRGVSQCADCDGPLYKNQDVVVVGGGDSALQEALVLARLCNTVYLVHRGSNFRAQTRFIQKVSNSPNITIIWNATVTAIAGGRTVERVHISLADGQVRDIPCAGIFPYIGLTPNSEFLPSQIKRSDAGFVVTDDTLATTLPGIWAIGAVRHGYNGLLKDAVDEGRRVAERIRERSK